MKSIVLIIIVLCTVTPSAVSQVFSKELGNIGDAEINLTTYARDRQAEAVILFDIGDSRFIDTPEGGYEIQFSREKRIKILTRAGIKYSEVSIPLYTDASGRSETLKSLIAVSYNYEDGQLRRTELNPSSVYDEKINTRWNAKKFVFPDVKPGTIIEYQYVMTTPFHFNLPDWEFQSRIPTVYSRLTVRMIPFYEYAFIVHGTNRFDYQTSTKDSKVRTFGQVTEVYGQNMGGGIKFQDMVHVYGMNNVPAFRDESYITSVDDYLIRMDFQLAKFNSPQGGSQEIMSTWPKLIQELIKYDEFGKYLNSCGKSAEKIIESELDLQGKSDSEKARLVINYVKSAFKWDGFYSIYSSKSPRDFVSQKKGNSTDINLFLTAMLNAAGLTADPVLISTRNNGKINMNYPFLSFFNYVVVMVNKGDQQFLCDGTEFYTQYNRIPPRCINDKGLLIKNGTENWVNLNPGYTSIDEKAVTFEIDPEKLRSKIVLNLQALEFDSYWYKNNFENDSVRLKKFLSEAGVSTISRLQIFNQDNAEKPYILLCEGESEIERLEDKLIISPFLGFYPKENRLTQPVRTYPIDFTYSNTEAYRCKIKIPEGYKVLTIPDGYNIENDLAKIKVNYVVSEGLIDMDCSYGFKKAVYPHTDYNNIKLYFDIIVKKFNEQIVLVKI